MNGTIVRVGNGYVATEIYSEVVLTLDIAEAEVFHDIVYAAGLAEKWGGTTESANGNERILIDLNA